MKNAASIIAFAFAGVVGAAGAQAAQPAGAHTWDAAFTGPLLSLAAVEDQREVITPPSSIDPGMALDPPETGAKMPIIRPPATRGDAPVLPR